MLDMIINIVKHLSRVRFTGVLTLEIAFSDGGIRSCEKSIKEKIVVNPGS